MLALMLTLALNSPAPAAPPDGTYVYNETFQGQPSGKTTVVVKRNADTIVATETASISALGHAVTGNDTLTLGAAMLSPISYNATYDVTGLRTIHAALNVNGAAATLTNDAVGNKSFPLAAGSKNFAVIDGGFMSGTMFVPAELALAGAAPASLTGIVPSFGAIVPIAFDATIKPSRPPGVSPGDVVLAVGGQAAFNIWYDAQTGIVDEVDVPSQNSTVIRQRQ